jgi:enterochelin esterase-like enzyme
MKINFSVFLPLLVVLVLVVFVYIYTAYRDKKDSIKDGSDPFAVPSGFDKRIPGYTYGTLTEKSYPSSTTGEKQKCYVYTPPGYNTKRTYPVMYLLHGIGGTHAEWKDEGNINGLLSNIINIGEAKRMIVVMPNIRVMNPNIVPSDVYKTENVNVYNNFINELKNDLMPFIEKKYKVSKERTGRAIAGLSMGGMESLNIGISMPETFGFIGAFSAAPSLPFSAEQMKLPDEYKNNTFILLCCGLEDGLLSFSKDYNKHLVDNGVKTTFYTIPGGHDFGVWKNGLYNFARRIFKKILI